MGDTVFVDRRISYLGDFTWSSMSSRYVHLKPMAIQNLSELERARLQEVAFNHLLQDYDLCCQITIPKDGHKRKKSLRRKLDSLSKERNKEFVPQAFGIPLSQVIVNDRAHKQRQDSQQDEHKDAADLVSSILQFAMKKPSKELSSSNSSLSSTSETTYELSSPNTPDTAPRARRRGGMCVDSITDLDNNQSRLLEALQLSLPVEAPSKKEKQDTKLSLNPIYRQVPQVVDRCCQHMEKYGLQTVGIFRVGSSKKRVRQLRDEFNRGLDVWLDEEHSVHDVAALLKEFLREMPDPLLTRELYTPFINAMQLNKEEQHRVLQLLIYLLPPCNCDTLHRLLQFLVKVAAHAMDAQDVNGHEVTGNKMTSLNLATIFGPNLLHKQKCSDKEFSVQSTARVEDSSAIIGVVQRMIASYESLFMVSCDMQNEVLVSLLETDPDVVDYLLRRKASQGSSLDLLSSDDNFSLEDRRSSSDSNKVSSGDISPYDNNSPVLLDHHPQHHSLRSPAKHTSTEQSRNQLAEASNSQCNPKEMSERHTDLWGAWHSTLKTGQPNNSCTGSHGNLLESKVSKRQSLPIQPDHAPNTASIRASSIPTPDLGRGSRDAPPLSKVDQSDSCSSVDIQQGVEQWIHPSNQCKPGQINKNMNRPPPPYPGLCRGAHKPQTEAAVPPGYTQTLQRDFNSNCPRRLNVNNTSNSTETLGPNSVEWQDWQRDRWQIWQILSSENSDTLPETLV